MFRILSLMIILATSVKPEPLSCYLCIGSLTGDCFNGVTSSMVIQQCEEYDEFSQNFTLHNTVGKQYALYINNKDEYLKSQCVSYTSTFANNGEHFIERGCGYMYVGVDICELLEAVDPTFPINDCSACSTELCNDGVF